MNCPHCEPNSCSTKSSAKQKSSIKKYGTYRRKSDSRTIQRFFCKRCSKTYSFAVNDPAYYHKKRRVNYALKRLLASCISQRRAAIILGVSRTTIARKLRYLGKLCRDWHETFLKEHENKVEIVQFDELHTIEHTKCKPLAVAVAVSIHNRKILGVEVSSVPASGHLAALARKKYGWREDNRKEGLKRLFKSISNTLIHAPKIQSDEHPYYKPLVKRFFPDANYSQTKGEKAAVTGQGELKKKKRDPLFYINHTLAMLRANINRLIRKTWCTTKDPARLLDHLAIYMWAHNSLLTA